MLKLKKCSDRYKVILFMYSKISNIFTFLNRTFRSTYLLTFLSGVYFYIYVYTLMLLFFVYFVLILTFFINLPLVVFRFFVVFRYSHIWLFTQYRIHISYILTDEWGFRFSWLGRIRYGSCSTTLSCQTELRRDTV